MKISNNGQIDLEPYFYIKFQLHLLVLYSQTHSIPKLLQMINYDKMDEVESQNVAYLTVYHLERNQFTFNIERIYNIYLIIKGKMQNVNTIEVNNTNLSEENNEANKYGKESIERSQTLVSTPEKIVRVRAQNSKKKRFNKSLWTLQENMKYIEFLKQNRQVFSSTTQNRRLLKINKLISIYIKTRSPDQCRSHHQKMVKYHSSIEGIITHVHLLKNMHQQDAGTIVRDVKNPLRIRKKVSKAEIETPTINEDVQKDLWDVLYLNQINQSFLQKGSQYL